MLGRLAIAGAVLALLGAGGANADPQREPMLVPPVSPACISSPFGPRVLCEPPPGGQLPPWRRSTGTAGRIDRGDGARQGDPYSEEGSRGTGNPSEARWLPRHLQPPGNCRSIVCSRQKKRRGRREARSLAASFTFPIKLASIRSTASGRGDSLYSGQHDQQSDNYSHE
jgi:hypothetical protein